MTIIRKPITLDTTLRNSAKMTSFISCIKPYEEEVLTHTLVLHIESDILKFKIAEGTRSTLNNYKTKSKKIKHET